MSAYPIGTLVDDPSTVPAGTGLMKRMCCRCELVMGWVVCQQDRAGRVTHDYCRPCAAAFEEELAQWYPAEEAARRAADITLGVGGAGLELQAATPISAGATAGAGEALARPDALPLCAPGACPDRENHSYGTGDTGHADGGRIL
jgi:hypothetical protein